MYWAQMCFFCLFECVFCSQENSETALHLAINEEDGTSLHMVDFLLQNSNRSVSYDMMT